jgi:hypothetical protein
MTMSLSGNSARAGCRNSKVPGIHAPSVLAQNHFTTREYDTATSPMLDNVAILIPVLSDAFVKSTACSTFVSLSEATKGARKF